MLLLAGRKAEQISKQRLVRKISLQCSSECCLTSLSTQGWSDEQLEGWKIMLERNVIAVLIKVSFELRLTLILVA
jgi:hypothetical protein